MPVYRKESLEALKQRIDIVEVLSSHLEMKRTGAAYKALCPFHDEKTPSFSVQKGDNYYHCFGCGAHGDAISFLMSHLKLSFSDAVENLAQRFQVHMEVVEGGGEEKGINKSALKDALENACRFYHFILLHTAEGHQALRYLYERGIDLDFIRHFHIGLAPKQGGLLKDVLMEKGASLEVMADAGLIVKREGGGYRDFFSDRITIPINHAQGYVIGFSARKYKEDTFGGKYVNTAETPLFKKSRILFGLHASRKRIVKERRAIIVEGQIDALRLILNGFDFTVAGQGTAFGEGHVAELVHLGVNEVFLAFDADNAGCEAAVKVGNLFQKVGVEVKIIKMPTGADPDAYLKVKGPQAFLTLMTAALDYLTFLVQWRSRTHNMESPASKSEIVNELAKQIREWDNTLMVHESLRKLAKLTKVPEKVIGVGMEELPNILIRQSSSIGGLQETIDPDRIMETDFLRWLVLSVNKETNFVALARLNIRLDDLKVPACRALYKTFLQHVDEAKTIDLMSLAISVDDAGAQQLIGELMHKKVNHEKAQEAYAATLQKILDRNWMQQREELKIKLHSGTSSDDDALELLKQFDFLKKTPPKIVNAEM